ncbi:beta-galactosidase isoform X3 [Aplysia californica]|uniref:Beta-galactosidase n=1 Tax=Aplysia californica TaxID=6500 RepID=A0ABM1VZZ1_APLCA|nr:beta-galactosidase isoform X3 [Aplysia californica]
MAVSTFASIMNSSLFIIVCVFLLGAKVSCERTFEVGYQNDTFLKDGKPFRYVAGSFHYSRVHPYYWEDRFVKMRAAGLNAAQVYVPWNVHEKTPGVFTWDGASDLGRFLSLAQKNDLVVLLRLGPYICGEWEFGGLPAWLLNENPDMFFRTSDNSYMRFVSRWYEQLLEKIKPSLYINGGPVVMVQIENEYGSYFACDRAYTASLRDKVREILGNDVVIYTTDGAGDGYLKCGAVPGVYATVDFGTTLDPAASFKAQRDYEPHGPLVNSEFYTGWLDHWGYPHSTTDRTRVAKSLDLLLAYQANINMYMYIGGTNFGFYNGANSPPYQPVPTSYDYDAPITEAGDITEKFYAVRDIVSKYLPLPHIPIPANTTKTAYGVVPMSFVSTVQDALSVLCPEGPVRTAYPIPMERIKFYFGFILYRFILTKDYSSPTILYTRGIRDRAVVMVNAVPFGILKREFQMSVNITGSKGQAVDILVENQGRIGFSTNMNFNIKGIVENVTLGGELVSDWWMYPLHLENINGTTNIPRKLTHSVAPRSSDGTMTTPSIYVGEIDMPGSTEPQDTYLDPRPWGKGQAIINNFNLGRYWPKRGPQVTLYVPKPVFVNPPAVNRLYLFEVDSAPCFDSTGDDGCNVTFTDTAYIDGPNTPDTVSSKFESYKLTHH